MKINSLTNYEYMFQANYKDTGMILTETVLLSVLSWALDIFQNYFI